MPGIHIVRLFEDLVRESQDTFRVVTIDGPRQVGKTTLLKRFAGDGIPFVSCEQEAVQDRIDLGESEFIANLGPKAVLDEIQERGGLLTAIKNSVDDQQDTGRFLVAGASVLWAHRQQLYRLTGRSCKLRLQPFCQAELQGTGYNGILQHFFSERSGAAFCGQEGAKIDALAARGGYPKLQKLTTRRQRTSWLRQYCQEIERKDLPQFGRYGTGAKVRDVLAVLAQQSGSLLSISQVGRQAGISHDAAARLVGALEKIGLIAFLSNFNAESGLPSMSRQCKLQFNDSGLLAVLLGVTEESAAAREFDAAKARMIFGCFVFSELAKLCNAQFDEFTLCHWKHGKSKVDMIISHEEQLVGVGVTRRGFPKVKDFDSLKKLARLAENMQRGVIIHAGEHYAQFMHNAEGREVIMEAIPAAWLWTRPLAQQQSLLEK